MPDTGKQSYNIIVSGDSISKGVVYDETLREYAVLAENYVSLLQGALRGIVRNTARFGQTLVKGLGRLRRDVRAAKPDVALIEYGGNDCDFDWAAIAKAPEAAHMPRTDYALFQAKLLEMIAYLEAEDVVPVLMTLPPLCAERYLKWISGNDPVNEARIMRWLGSATKIYWWQERYNAAILAVAAETGTRWIDVRGAFLREPDYERLLCVDGIHPNGEGHKVIAAKILEFIRDKYEFLLKGA